MKTPDSDPPVAKHLTRTKELVDFLKYVALLVGGILSIGWWGHGYISQFQTSTEAAAVQRTNATAQAALTTKIDIASGDIQDLRIHALRVELEQRSTNDRLDQLLQLSQADTPTARTAARRRVSEIQLRIDRRTNLIRTPGALQRTADRMDRDPLGTVNDL